MFDIGFSELLLIGIVALVVIGPERLPKVARTVGLLLGRAQRYVATVKADLHREMQLEEVQRAAAALKESMQATGQQIGSAVNDLHQQLQSIDQPAAVAEPVSEAASHETEASECVQIELPLESPEEKPIAAPLSPAAAHHATGESSHLTEKADHAA